MEHIYEPTPNIVDDSNSLQQLEFMPRSSWTHIPHSDRLKKFTMPPKYVFFGYTRKIYDKKPSPGPRPDQYTIFRELEHLLYGDRARDGMDIRYNFMLGPDGRIYEGRGWIYAPMLPTKYYKKNLDSLYITFIGDFSKERPSEELFRLRQQFLRYAVMKYFIRMRFSMITLPDQYGYYLEPFSHYNY